MFGRAAWEGLRLRLGVRRRMPELPSVGPPGVQCKRYDCASDPVAVVTAIEGQRATYIGESLRALLAPYPEISVQGGTATCAGWTAIREDGGALTLKGDGTPVDGLRALAAAAWSSPEPVSRAQAEAALEDLHAAGLPR